MYISLKPFTVIVIHILLKHVNYNCIISDIKNKEN